MRIKKTYLKISLLALALLLALSNYVFINLSKKPNLRHGEYSSDVNIGVSSKTYLAAYFQSPDEISKNLLKDPIINGDYRFIHTSQQACTNKSVDLVVVIQSFVINFDRRRIARQIRHTRPANGIVYLFFMGKAPNLESLQNRVDYEASQFGDVVQADVHDSMQNLSLLSASMLKWVANYCPNVSFVVKKIDDGEINVVNILQAFRQKEIDYKYFIMGNSAVVTQSPLRYAIHYYYKSISEYKDYQFALFIQEPVYGFSRRTAMVLYQAFLRTKLFWKEDVYITGICANRASVPVFFDFSFVYK